MKFQSNTIISLTLVLLLMGSFSCGSKGDPGGIIDLLPPSTLVATAVGQQINLTWLDQNQGEEGFKLERKITGGEFQEIRTLAADSQSCSDTGLSASTAYFYRLRAFKGGTFSVYSNEATATTGIPGLTLAKIFFSVDDGDGNLITINDGKLQVKLGDVTSGACPPNGQVSVSRFRFDRGLDIWEPLFTDKEWVLFPAGSTCTTGQTSSEFDLGLNDVIPGAANGIVTFSRSLINPGEENIRSVDLTGASPIVYAYTADVSNITGYKNLDIGAVYTSIEEYNFNPYYDDDGPVHDDSITDSECMQVFVRDGTFNAAPVNWEYWPDAIWLSTSHFTENGWETIVESKLVNNSSWSCGFDDLIINDFDMIIDWKAYTDYTTINRFSTDKNQLIVGGAGEGNKYQLKMIYVYNKDN